jgi:hypothetical protein
MGDMIKDAAKHFKVALTGNANDVNTFSSQLAHLPPLPLPATLQSSSSISPIENMSREAASGENGSSGDVLGTKSPPPSLIVQLRSENMANKAKDIKLFALLEVLLSVVLSSQLSVILTYSAARRQLSFRLCSPLC